MENQSDYNEALLLIVDEFEGIISESDLQKLQTWRIQSEENERIYQEFHSIRIEVDVLVNLKQLSVDDSWERLDAQLVDEPMVLPLLTEDSGSRSKSLVTWMSIAASIALLLGFFFYQQGRSVQTLATSKGGHLRFSLPDGSFVALNEETEVQYNSADFAENRTVKLLRGEAYLVVQHNELRPFKVLAGDAVVEDLGTAFSVSRNQNSVKVFVNSGKVMLKAVGNGSSKLILPQHAAVLDAKNQVVNEIPAGQVSLHWLQTSLTFSNTDLSEIISKLERVYQADINLEAPSLNNRKLTANLSYPTVDSALSVVAASLQLEVNKVKGKYTISE